MRTGASGTASSARVKATDVPVRERRASRRDPPTTALAITAQSLIVERQRRSMTAYGSIDDPVDALVFSGRITRHIVPSGNKCRLFVIAFLPTLGFVGDRVL